MSMKYLVLGKVTLKMKTEDEIRKEVQEEFSQLNSHWSEAQEDFEVKQRLYKQKQENE